MCTLRRRAQRGRSQAVQHDAGAVGLGRAVAVVRVPERHGPRDGALARGCGARRDRSTEIVAILMLPRIGRTAFRSSEPVSRIDSDVPSATTAATRRPARRCPRRSRPWWRRRRRCWSGCPSPGRGAPRRTRGSRGHGPGHDAVGTPEISEPRPPSGVVRPAMLVLTFARSPLKVRSTWPVCAVALPLPPHASFGGSPTVSDVTRAGQPGHLHRELGYADRVRPVGGVGRSDDEVEHVEAWRRGRRCRRSRC